MGRGARGPSLHSGGLIVVGYRGTHRARLRRKEEQEDQLEALDPGYWEEDFDAAGTELAALPAHWDEAVLEAELESRTRSLEVGNPHPEPHCCLSARDAAAKLLTASHTTYPQIYDRTYP